MEFQLLAPAGLGQKSACEQQANRTLEPDDVERLSRRFASDTAYPQP